METTTNARTGIRTEIALVLGVSLGASAVYSAVSLLAKLTAGKPLADQHATLNASQAPGRPWLDLTYQLLGIAFAVLPALFAVHLLRRDDPQALRVERRPLFDTLTGAGLAALIGIPGLVLYVGARALGLNASVIPAALPDMWWTVPVLILAAVQNAILEEVVVVGYLLTRLRQLHVRLPVALAASALLRGSYHLYQGFGAFVGNAIMGLVFGLVFTRTRRVWPLIIAHSVLDIVAFVGWTLGGNKLLS
ncbi:membrane protein [Longispora fulva]|uniref:Membrane protease YdiL (CAAX protease family) n=1 Tax=Longispora fulva TaxID=619741 RepID=A0A8J7GLB1_9ACTN|nr:type II CAAX endopeptidase family protein [Longispora fulva]MBG6139795.1 membrane protease YdiL (CAAX protease family) [Longispora fulva]GIG57821.1 membrane protein [Longispora fulva]